jgi:hypothetical protein
MPVDLSLAAVSSAPLLQYSILVHALVSSEPSADLPLLTLPARDDALPQIVLSTNMRVWPRLGKDLEPDKDAKMDSVKVEPKRWELITMTVDCLYGKLSIYLNGELHMRVNDPETINMSSPYALSREEGVKFFSQAQKYKTTLSVRKTAICASCLSPDEVAAQHIELFAWRCEKEKCGKLVGPGRATCPRCKTKRSQSAPVPEENPDPKTGVFTVVAKTFEKEVLQQREYGGETTNPVPVLVLFYRASKHSSWEADEVLSEWSRFASLMRGSPLRVCAYDLEKNDSLVVSKCNLQTQPAVVLFGLHPDAALATGAGGEAARKAKPQQDEKDLEEFLGGDGLIDKSKKAEALAYLAKIDVDVSGFAGPMARLNGRYRLVEAGEAFVEERPLYRHELASPMPHDSSDEEDPNASHLVHYEGGWKVDAGGMVWAAKAPPDREDDATCPDGPWIAESPAFGSPVVTRSDSIGGGQGGSIPDMKVFAERGLSVSKVFDFLQLELAHQEDADQAATQRAGSTRDLLGQAQEVSDEKDSIARPVVDIASLQRQCFARYWRQQGISSRLQSLREAILGTAYAADSPLRYMSMWLSDERNFAAVIDDEEATEWAKVEQRLGVQKAKGMKADFQRNWQTRLDAADRATDPAALVQRELFTPTTAEWAQSINPVLEEMLTALRDNMPLDPRAFALHGVLSRPIRVTEPPVSSMGISQTMHCWAELRSVVASSTIDAGGALERLFSRGYNVDAAPFGHCLLHMAAAQGNGAVVDIAAARGANLHTRSKDNVMPLEAAAAMGHTHVVRRLLELGAHFGLALHYAAAAGQAAVVQLLIQEGAAFDAAQPLPGGGALRYTPMDLAVKHRHHAVMALLAGKGVVPRQVGERKDGTKEQAAVDPASRFTSMDDSFKEYVQHVTVMVSGCKERFKVCNGVYSIPSISANAGGSDSGDSSDGGDNDEDAFPENDNHPIFALGEECMLIFCTKDPLAEGDDSGDEKADGNGGLPPIFPCWVLMCILDDDAPNIIAYAPDAAEGKYMGLPPPGAWKALNDLVFTPHIRRSDFDGPAVDTTPTSVDEPHGSLSPSELAQAISELVADGYPREALQEATPGFERVQRQLAICAQLKKYRDEAKAVWPTEVEVDARDTLQWTSFMYAALYNDGDQAETLLALGANPTARNRLDFSALLWAHWHKSKFFLVALEDVGSGLQGRDKEGHDRLSEAVRRHKGSKAVESILCPGRPRERCKIVGTGGHRRRGEGNHDVTATYATPTNEAVVDETLEDCLLEIDTQYPSVYPVHGRFKGDMAGLIQSCKVATADCVAAGKAPQCTPLDIFACHLYTRPELAPLFNAAYLDGDEAEIGKWRKVVWHIKQAVRNMRSVAGVHFRGVHAKFETLNLSAYRPGAKVHSSTFSSYSVDLRVALNFLYELDDPAQAEGVVFKLFSHTGATIEEISLLPEEKEVLFLPGSTFRVVNWYPATDYHLRRGLPREQDPEERAFLLDCQQIVQPAPLAFDDNMSRLRGKLKSNKLILVELEEAVLTEEERLHEAAEMREMRRQLEADLEAHAAAPLDEIDAEGQVESVAACLTEAQKAGISGDLIRRAKTRMREWKRELKQQEIGDELRAFKPVLELAAESTADDFDALLMELEELEDKVARNPKRKVEVGRLTEVVAAVQGHIKTAIDAKLGDAWRQKAAGEPEAAEEMEQWLTSVTARVDDKFRKLYAVTLEIIKDEAGAEEALGRIHAWHEVVASKKPESCHIAEDSSPMQCTRDQVELFCHAARVRPRVTAFMKRFDTGKESSPRRHDALKRNARIAEKIMLRPAEGEGQAESIFDVVRNMYEASTLREVADVVDDMCKCEAIEVVRIKDRFAEPSPGGWSDCMINYVLRDDPHSHICELQISHRSLVLQRKQLKAHAVYGHTRNALELREKLAQ